MLNILRVAVLLLVGLPVSAAGQIPSPASGPSFPLAYFSPQRAFLSSPDGKMAQAKLSSLEAEKSKEISARGAALKQLQDALQQASSVLDAAARRLREQDIERFDVDLQRFIQDSQAEFLGVQKE